MTLIWIDENLQGHRDELEWFAQENSEHGTREFQINATEGNLRLTVEEMGFLDIQLKFICSGGKVLAIASPLNRSKHGQDMQTRVNRIFRSGEEVGAALISQTIKRISARQKGLNALDLGDFDPQKAEDILADDRQQALSKKQNKPGEASNVKKEVKPATGLADDF